MTLRIAAVVPTYDNPATIATVVGNLRPHFATVFVVDDGSGPEGRTACDALAKDGRARLVRLPQNRGKGGAVKAGFAAAAEAGFTHVFQVDADGQHDLACIPAFLAAAEQNPAALVLGYPEYDASVPKARLAARRVTTFWVDLEVGRKGLVRDAMIGCRIYPLDAALRSRTRGDRMDFDVEIVVRMARMGVPVVNLPVRVRYLSRDEGGVSHFQPFRDNLRLSLMHSRICTGICTDWFLRPFRRRRTP